MDWITEHIAVGSFIDAQHADPDDVDAILCLIADCCDEDDVRFDVLNLPLVDGPGNDSRRVHEALAFVHDAVSNGKRILVHCHAGRSRSVCIVVRYLMTYMGRPRQQAIAMVQAKHDIYLSPGIEEILAM